MYKYFRIAAFSFIVLFTACKEETTIKNDILPVQADTLTLNGVVGNEGGQNARNSIFVDLSKSVQKAVLRESWDVALYCGPEFRVILNHSVGATAVRLDKTRLEDVLETDSAALITNKKLEFGTTLNNVDAVAGDLPTYLSGTVLEEVSATDAENKVYIINRGLASDATKSKRGWEKILVKRMTNGYVLQFGKIKEGGGLTRLPLTVIKDPSFNFRFISFTNNVVSVEPQKTTWDIEWTYSTYKTSSNIPSAEHDFVMINFVAGVQAAQLIFSGDAANTTISYDNFAEADLTGVTFVRTRDVIGTNWRTIATSNGTTLAAVDRYYLIKDIQGNIYKLRFLQSETGKPIIEYRLVKPYKVFSANT